MTEPHGTSAAEESPGAKRAPTLLAEPGVLQRIICALFAWAVTILPVALSRVGSWPSRLVAVVAIAAGIIGPLLVPTRRRVGRHVGISAFVGGAALVWALSPAAVDVSRVDLVLAITGSVSWMVFAFSWGEPWKFRADSQPDELGATLRARAELPPFAVPIASLGVLTAAGLLVLGFRVRDTSRALLAQVVAIGLGVAMVTVAASLATGRGKQRAAQSDLPKPAVRALLVLAAAALIGAAILVLRRG